MTEPPEALSDAARAIAAGAPVDWRGLESSAPDDEARRVLRELEAVAGIAAFHRDWGQAWPVAGTTWNHLQIIREIGRGSFGRVYLARDPHLDRDVALKVIETRTGGLNTEDIVNEGRRLARLHHSNIVAIHGADRVGTQIGLEMEFIEGRTLAEMVQDRGRFNADEAALIGRDVARALAAVHQAGLVHRDVKAQNVIRERGGRIVLMDFGAAGTPLYLAPEVLAGGTPSPQSDLYSLGVLLFFLTTGTYPVHAKTLDDLRAAHRDGVRKSLSEVRGDLPAEFVAIVETALAPDPVDRIDSAGTFEARLSQVIGGPHHHIGGAGRRRRLLPWAAGAAMLLGGATAIAALRPTAASPTAGERFYVPVDGYLTIPSGPGSREFAISPDGTTLVYACSGRTLSPAGPPQADCGWPQTASAPSPPSAPGRGSHILLRRLNEAGARLIYAGDAGQPFFSPDSQRIGVLSSNRLLTLPTAGGASVNVTAAHSGGATWNTDGTIVFTNQRALWQIAEGGGEPVRLTEPDVSTDERHIRPQVLSNGDVIFTRRRHRSTTTAVMLRRSTGEIQLLMDKATSGQYLPPGYLVFVAGNPPWITVAPYDVQRGAITGAAVQMEPVKPTTHWFDVSDSGSLVFTTPEEPPEADRPRLVWVDRVSGREEPLNAAVFPGEFLNNSLLLSPDGRHLAFARPSFVLTETANASTPGTLVIANLLTGSLGAPLMTEPVAPLGWSNDSQMITYRKDDGAIAWRRADGAGPEQLIAAGTPELFSCTTGAWSPDGRTLLLGCGAEAGRGRQRWMSATFESAAAVGRSPVTFAEFLDNVPGMGAASFSSDGRWMAYSANIGGRAGGMRVYVRAFPGPGPVFTVSPDVGRSPIWRGSTILYTTPAPTAIAVRTGDFFSFGRPDALPADFARYDLTNDGRLVFDASPDGRKLLMLKRASGRGGDYLTRLRVVPHWIEDVKRKVGVR